MELKVLKKEIDNLTSLKKTLDNFKSSWLKPIQANTNPNFPFLQNLSSETKHHLNFYLREYQHLFPQLTYFQFTQEKLSSLAYYLIELKLTSLNGTSHKQHLLINKFLNDDFLSLKLLIDEMNQFHFNLNRLNELYQQANQLLLRALPLEHSTAFLDSPHKNHLNALFLITKKQKQLLKTLSREFISLTKQLNKHK